ncbi:hypothetical protein IWT25_00164 [Secundilactobacillus pentosiphilus]|uniref:Uncharacterized protein n=1 Tax=Secundilactobacillus pentosiphilus TaxID=1714682 RepID=A0A1Z5ISZ0_9LACO|nr:hypothetical protein [Secundilactobacillus pentosiphilus]GAX04870.1 hypothetical protein IWT25_00164 [Secundilactobacillus pentosiphilus]
MKLQTPHLGGFSQFNITVNGKTGNNMMVHSNGQNEVKITGRFVLQKLARVYEGNDKAEFEPHIWFGLFILNNASDFNYPDLELDPIQVFSIDFNEVFPINSVPVDLDFNFPINDATFKTGYLILMAMRPIHTSDNSYISPVSQLNFPIRGDGNGK